MALTTTLAVAATLPLLPRRAFPWSRPKPRLDGLRQLVCRSCTSRDFTEAELEYMLALLQERQEQHGGHVSGAVLHHDDSFFFCLEGPEQAVLESFARLHRDPHHHTLEEVLYRPVKTRQFPRWIFASTVARGGGWLDQSTMAWELERRGLVRTALSPVTSLMNRTWEAFRLMPRRQR